MDKEEWIEGVKRLQAILKDAEDTQQKSLNDIEELKFTISKYQEKIETFK